MALPNFTDQKIQETYQRVVQKGENGQLFDGTGSLIPLQIDGSDLIVSGAVRAQSYIVSESITVVTSGSTIFGDSSDDTHKFIGSIDAVDGDFDGTLEADAITVGGTALNTVIASVTVTNATNAVNATHISVADNENTNENNLITFIENTSATGNVGLESDGDFTYNPSTGTVSATKFDGLIDGGTF